MHTHTHTHLCTTSDMSVCFLYVMQNTELFSSSGCLSFYLFFLKYLSVGTFLSFFPSVCRDGGLKLSLPYLPPLLSTFLSLLQQHRKMGHEERKKWQRKTKMRSNLILIWFLLGSCFNPLWAGFFFCVHVCVWVIHRDWSEGWLILVTLTQSKKPVFTFVVTSRK